MLSTVPTQEPIKHPFGPHSIWTLKSSHSFQVSLFQMKPCRTSTSSFRLLDIFWMDITTSTPHASNITSNNNHILSDSLQIKFEKHQLLICCCGKSNQPRHCQNGPHQHTKGTGSVPASKATYPDSKWQKRPPRNNQMKMQSVTGLSLSVVALGINNYK